MLPVSVHILTKNSATTLERALKSVQNCQEIFVIDDGSTDATRDIAKRFNARILEQPADALENGNIVDFSRVRNTALEETSQPWVLALDSDEEASKELMEEIGEICRQNKAGAYFVPRRYRWLDGQMVMHATSYPNERIYFFHKDSVEKWIKPVHERVQVKPGTRIGHLKGSMLADVPTAEEYKQKNERYIQIEAERSKNDGWLRWLQRVIHTLRSRVIILLKLIWIWCLPHSGKRLPLRLELMKFWYGWRLAVATMPRKH